MSNSAFQQSIVLDRVSPIIWRPVNKIVVDQVVRHVIKWQLVSPCTVISYKTPRMRRNTESKCQTFWHEEVITKLTKIKKTRSRSFVIGAATGAIFFYCISSCYFWIKSWFTSEPLQTYEFSKYIQEKDQLNEEIHRGLFKTLDGLNEKVDRLIRQSEYAWQDSIEFSLALAAISKLSRKLDKFVEIFEQGLISTYELSDLLNISEFKNFQTQDTNLLEANFNIEEETLY